MIDTNETLLERVKRVDAHDAWQEFYKAYWSAILRYARKLGLNEHQAQEVLQDTMLTLMRQLPAFSYDRSKGKFRNFLLTIVHRKSLMIHRRARGEKEISFDSEDPWQAGSLHEVLQCGAAVAGERAAEERWRESLMEDAIQNLTRDPAIEEETLTVFRAYVLENLPAGEVARKFGLKENAVYQIKNRLLRRLQAQVARRLRDSGSGR